MIDSEPLMDSSRTDDLSQMCLIPFMYVRSVGGNVLAAALKCGTGLGSSVQRSL